MPAKSKAQQRFMGMVYAAKKGEKPASKEVAKAAKGMSKKSAKKFAKTKHKGLPEHVKKKKAKKKKAKKEDMDITKIADMISEDPSLVIEHCGQCNEDATGSGGVAAGGEAITDDRPMTEEGKEGGGHKCKICGEPCGDDKACDTKDCPNNREEGPKGKKAQMENKNMKGLKLIKESAKGRLTRRTHRMMHVASGGRILTEDEWKAKVGDDNLALAKSMGLLQIVEGKLLNEQPMVGGEEGPPEFEGDEEEVNMGDLPFGDDEADVDAAEEEEVEEEVEEEMPITKDELAKFLEALMDRADEEALAMIHQAISSEEEMEGEMEEAEEAEETAEALEDAAEEDEEEEELAEEDKKWGQKALKDADKPPSEGGTKGSLRKMMGKKKGEKITRGELKKIIDSPSASKEKKQKALAIYNLGGGAK